MTVLFNRMSRRALLGAAVLAGFGTTFDRPAAQPLRPKLSRGINTWPWFSLTREYPAPRIDYGTPPFQTERPVPTPEDLAALRRAGFDFVRIPVDPGPFVSAKPTMRTDLLATLSQAVDMALDAGLAVVVNIQANAATHYWNPELLYASTAAPEFAAYRSFVAEVAALIGAVDPTRIALEPVNEPFQACSSGEWPSVQLALLTAARVAAPNLPLIATGSCGSMPDGLAALDPKPLASLEPLIFTFHFYEPYVFSHQGAPWMSEPIYRWLNAVPWPASAGSFEATMAAVRRRMAEDTETPAEARQAILDETERAVRVYFDADPGRAYLDAYMAEMRRWADANGIAPGRILMGEFGALRTDERYVAAGPADRARYVRDVRESAEAAGFPWAFWNLFDGMGVMDDRTRQFDPAMLAALGLDAPVR